MKDWWIGCSGFHYKGWKEKFYPPGLPQRLWFEYYCAHFNTVELNVTFYRFPTAADLEGWYNQSPSNFRFTVKANRGITHYRKFSNVKKQIGDFYNSVEKGLRDKLGPVLFQLHPNFAYSEENLDRITATLDPAFSNAVEFRHPSWWTQDVYRVLREKEITFCSISYPDLPDDLVKTAPVVYYRFHGVPDLYLSSYGADELSRIAASIKALKGVKEVYCYFNNDMAVAAVDNAKTLMEEAGLGAPVGSLREERVTSRSRNKSSRALAGKR